MLRHKHAIRGYPGYSLNGTTISKVYAVETDLVLEPDRPGFDQEAFADFTKAVVDYIEKFDFDSATLIPVGEK